MGGAKMGDGNLPASSRPDRPRQMSTTRAVWFFIAALTVLRFSMLATKDLEFDEAHYWMWSERLAPAYFSKGPGVAFAIRASTAIFGANEFGVRFFSPVLAAATSLLLFYLGRRLFSGNAGLWLVMGLNVTPIFNVGALLMTIDPLSIFFWTAAMFAFWLALERSPLFSWCWPVTGFLIGLGFLSKYTNGLELISVILVLVLAPRLRHEFKRPGLYSLLAAFALCALPPIIWNQYHAWVTLTHLRARGSLDQRFDLHLLEPLKFLGEHFLFYSPLLFLGLAWGVLASWRRINQQFKVLCLFWFGIPVFVFYFLLSLNKVAAPNWDALAFLSFALLAIGYWEHRIESNRWLRRSLPIALGLALLMTVIALDSDLLRTAGVRLWRRDPSDRLRGWKSATAAVESVRHDLEAKLGEKLFLIADHRDRASEISFYLRDKRVEGPGHPPVYLVVSQDLVNQFSFWPRYDQFIDAPQAEPAPGEEPYTEEGGINPFTGRSALFIRDGPRGGAVHNIRAAFQTCRPVAIVEVHRFGQHIRTWRIFLCQNYRSLPL
jgi:hypothetical protein